MKDKLFLMDISGDQEEFKKTVTFYEDLTITELKVLQHMSIGLSCTEIGKKMKIAKATVYYHRKEIFSKLDVNKDTRAVYVGMKLNILN